jgi:acetyl esterase/lipase
VWRKLLKAFATVAVLLAVGFAAAWWSFRPVTPDSFYAVTLDANASPGTLLKQEVFTRKLPPDTKAWRILYQTTRHDGKAAVASAVVVVPTNAKAPAPLIAWAHGTTGIATGCAPSLFENPFPYIPAFSEISKNGWAFVATDYVGMGTEGQHAYLIGDDAARNVLDALRAARQIKEFSFDSRALVWGHSQGGHSALWSGMRASSYAPDIKLLGIAALAPASDLSGLMQKGKDLPFGKIISALVLESYAAQYDDVNKVTLANGWSRFWAADVARRCVGGRETLLSLLETKLLPSSGVFLENAMQSPFGDRLRQNTPGQLIPLPLFIGQGDADDLVFPEVQLDYVKTRCAAGQALDYRRYAGRDHLSLVADDSPLVSDLLNWTADRLNSMPAKNTCPN